jgi:hypothetical protein
MTHLEINTCMIFPKHCYMSFLFWGSKSKIINFIIILLFSCPLKGVKFTTSRNPAWNASPRYRCQRPPEVCEPPTALAKCQCCSGPNSKRSYRDNAIISGRMGQSQTLRRYYWVKTSSTPRKWLEVHAIYRPVADDCLQKVLKVCYAD